MAWIPIGKRLARNDTIKDRREILEPYFYSALVLQPGFER